MAEPFVIDGKTREAIPYDPDVPMDVYTWYILNLIQFIGFEAAERYIFGGRERMAP